MGVVEMVPHADFGHQGALGVARLAVATLPAGQNEFHTQSVGGGG